MTKNKSDHVLVQNELNKLKTFDLSYFIGKNYFEEDGTPNYLIFQPLLRYFKLNNKNSAFISSWKSRDYLMKQLNPHQISTSYLIFMIVVI